MFALSIAWLLVRAASQDPPGSSRRRHAILGWVIVMALGIAEGKLLWYPSHYRAISDSAQGLLLQEQGRLQKRRIFQAGWDRAEIFVVDGMLGAERRLADRVETFWRDSQPGYCLIAAPPLSDPGLVLIRSGPNHTLYCRAE